MQNVALSANSNLRRIGHNVNCRAQRQKRIFA